MTKIDTKILKVTGDLTQFKNEYCKTIKGLKEDSFQVRLTYVDPKTLHTSEYMRDDVVSNTHLIKRLFFTDGRIANCMWDESLEAKKACYIPLKKKNHGFELPLMGLQTVEIITNAQQDHSKAWQAIADSMKKYNINLGTAEAIEKGIAGKTECNSKYCKKDGQSPYHTHFCQNYWDMKKDKPRTMSFADVVNRFEEKSIARLKELANKSNYGDYLVYHDSLNGIKRDRSIEFTVYPDGKMRFTSASEYSGCGNGSYYTMYSPTMAVYCEDD